MRLPRMLTADRRGSATVEFALLTLFFLGVMTVVLDYAFFFIQRSQLGTAVESASVSAFSNRDTVTYSNIPTFVQQAAKPPAGTSITVTTGCNGGSNNCVNTSRSCSCLTTTGTFVAAASCGAVCSGANMTSGSTAGYYLKITASYAYQPIVLPQGALDDRTISQSATVRLQ
ncbi:TadE/TadG family type IV pilus assembly protein [Sphingomonas sp. CJ99]